MTHTVFIYVLLATHLFMTAFGAKYAAGISGRNTTLTEQQKDYLVDIHNKFRRMEKASNMMKLTWDLSLQQSAQVAADRCAFGHTPRHTRPYGEEDSGENIFVSTRGFALEEPVGDWWKEIYDYRYSDNTCFGLDHRIDCGHYTAIVWATTHSVGCAINLCHSIGWWGNSTRSGYVMFCHYGPGGDNYDRPYRTGEVCSECPSHAPFCDNGLCSDTKPVTTEAPPVVLVTKRCADDWYTSGEKCYKFFDEKVNYEAAQAKCAEKQAVVAMPKTEAEQNDVKASRSHTIMDSWLGVVYLKDMSLFVWADHTIMSWMFWRSRRQPDNVQGDRLCVTMRPLGYWKNVVCTSMFNYVCQRDN